MKILSKVDYFGSNIGFSIHQHSLYQTQLGGFLTLSAVCIGIIAFLFFGKNLYLKQNPNIIASSVFPSETVTYPVNSQNFTFMWRLQDKNGNAVSLESTKIFPKIAYKVLDRHNTTQNLAKLQEVTTIYPKASICSKTAAISNELVRDFPLYNMYCLDWEDMDLELGKRDMKMEMGGGMDENYLAYISLEFTNCQIDKYGNPITSQCSDYLSVTKDLQQREVSVSFYFLTYSLNPQNYDKPFKLSYQNLFYHLDPTLIPHVEYSFSQDQLIDDSGWLYENLNLTTVVRLKNNLITYGL